MFLGRRKMLLPPQEDGEPSKEGRKSPKEYDDTSEGTG